MYRFFGLFLALQLLSPLYPFNCFAQQMMYIDESGNIIHVDSIDQVPMPYRHQFDNPRDFPPMDEKARKKLIKELEKAKKKREKEELKLKKEQEREKKRKEKELLKLKKEAEKEAKKNRRFHHRFQPSSN